MSLKLFVSEYLIKSFVILTFPQNSVCSVRNEKIKEYHISIMAHCARGGAVLRKPPRFIC